MRSRLFLALLFGALSSMAFAASPRQTPIAIEKLMSSADFRLAGLNKLTKAELAALNVWLTAHIRAEESAGATDDVVVSRIDGDFSGWDGDTIFLLTNGQIWQQASVSVFVAVRIQPKVTIYRSDGGYVMKVDGVERTLRVRRLK